MITSSKARTAVNQKGTTGEKELKSPPMSGPTIKPMPKAIPISPRLRVLSCGFLEMSTRELCAVEIFPAAMPSMIRPMKRNMRLRAEAKTSQPRAVLAMLMIRTGRRPIRSDSAPRKGLLIKEQKAKTPKSNATEKADV